MSTQTTTPTPRRRPVSQAIGSIADGISTLTPVAMDTVVEGFLVTRNIMELVNINLETALIEERAEALHTIKGFKTEFGFDDNELRAITHGSRLAKLVI